MCKQQEYLNKVKIATPCKADWDKMEGDDRVRHCKQCDLNVFNISEMSQEEATKLIQNKTGRLCIQMYRRKDGTVLTNDCPVGLRRLKKAYTRCAVAAMGMFAWMGIMAPGYAQSKGEIAIDTSKDSSKNAQWSRGVISAPPVVEKGKMVAQPEIGDIALPEGGLVKGADKGTEVVTDVDIKNKNPISCTLERGNRAPVTKPLKKENSERNRLLAAGLSFIIIGAVFKFIFGKMKRKTSMWIVGSSFAGAFIAIGLIWSWFW